MLTRSGPWVNAGMPPIHRGRRGPRSASMPGGKGSRDQENREGAVLGAMLTRSGASVDAGEPSNRIMPGANIRTAGAFGDFRPPPLPGILLDGVRAAQFPGKNGAPAPVWLDPPTRPSRHASAARKTWYPPLPIHPVCDRMRNDRHASSAMYSPMASEAVAAGEGALSTWTARSVAMMRKSSTRLPSGSTA